jgi:Spy/CpxP family protein refolding chaperone
MKKLYAIVLALSFLGMAVIAAAAPDPVTGTRVQADCRGPAGLHQRIAAFLDLSKEQQEKMKEVKNRFHADTRDLRYELLQKRLEMRKLFGDPRIDDATLLAKQKELAVLKLKLFERRGQMKIELRKIFTAEQIQKLDRIPLHPGMGPGRHRGMRPGMGPGMGPGMTGFGMMD